MGSLAFLGGWAQGREGRAAGDLAKGLSKAASEPAENGSPCAAAGYGGSSRGLTRRLSL